MLTTELEMVVEALTEAANHYVGISGCGGYLPHIEAQSVAAGLITAKEMFSKLRELMEDRILIVPNDNPKGTYMPVKGTTRDMCYEALYNIQKILHTDGFIVKPGTFTVVRLDKTGGEEKCL